MEFNRLIDDFAERHNVDNLVAVDEAAALDVDGIIVTIVAKGGVEFLCGNRGPARRRRSRVCQSPA